MRNFASKSCLSGRLKMNQKEEDMRKIIGMGETILDILFRDGQPVAAVCGGSSFNSIVSVGRAGFPCAFVGYTGGDIVGKRTIDFMHENNISTDYYEQREGEKSAISLAFLSKEGDANYLFYKETPRSNLNFPTPQVGESDVLLFGSYYACCDGMRPQVERMLRCMEEAQGIVYYDLNFRRSHAHELDALLPAIHWNMEKSTIVRGSADDFEVMYNTRDARKIYNKHIRQHCPIFVCTAGEGIIVVCTPSGEIEYQAPRIDNVVSTVGAGDNFNAGFVCSLLQQQIKKEELLNLPTEKWTFILQDACAFASQACQTTENYISKEFGQKYFSNK